MKAIGIIAEYNPFHNGHLYHLEKAKELDQDAPVVLVMSGNFTERGEVSIMDKWNYRLFRIRNIHQSPNGECD